jgi:hypothetical protein
MIWKHVYMLCPSFIFRLFSGAKMKSYIYVEPFVQKQVLILTCLLPVLEFHSKIIHKRNLLQKSFWTFMRF